MAVSGIIGVANVITALSGRNDDDFVDRLHYRYTTTMMVVFSAVVTMTHWLGTSITCWVPKHFSGSWNAYADQYCWVRNTYYLPHDQHIPTETEPKNYLVYYQWVPVYLLMQALLFVLPIFFWRNLSLLSGLDTKLLMEQVEKYDRCEEKRCDRRDTLHQIVDHFEVYLRNLNRLKCTAENAYDRFWQGFKRIISLTLYCLVGHSRGTFLMGCFIICKFLFLLNCIFQFVLLNWLLGMDFFSYGVYYFHNWVTGAAQPDPYFPRVTMCDLKVRFIGNVQRYTMQCVLPINLYIEKIYFFIWFWLLLLIFITAINLLVWIIRMAVQSDCNRFINRHLDIIHRYGHMRKTPRLDELRPTTDDAQSNYSDERRRKMENFRKQWLHTGVIFVLRMIEHNSNQLTVSDILYGLWKRFKAEFYMDVPFEPATLPVELIDKDEETPKKEPEPTDSPSPSPPPPYNPDVNEASTLPRVPEVTESAL